MGVGNERADASVDDVAKHFGVSPRTVRRWLANTDIPHRRATEAGTIRFNLDEVDAWMARGSEKPETAAEKVG